MTDNDARRTIFSRAASKTSHWLKRYISGNQSFSSSPQASSQESSPIKIVVDNQLLAKKNVLIVGVGKNIGQAIAVEMAQQGANLFLVDIDALACERIKTALQKFPVTVQSYVADISNSDSVSSLCQTLKAKNIAIDVLVNNVGIQTDTIGLQRSTLTQWQQAFNTNVIGPVYLTQQIVENMTEHGTRGSIIFTSSIHQFTVSRWPSYSASKAALGMVIEELAVDLAGHGIRVNGIAPGWVAEDTDGGTFDHPYTPLWQSSISPAYIGRAAVYLAADSFSYHTTGTVLKIDGGLSLYNSRVAEHPPESNF